MALPHHSQNTSGSPVWRDYRSGVVTLEVDDPLLVRADLLVVDYARHILTAVVDGTLQDITPAEEELQDLFDHFARQERVRVTAPHFSGGSVERWIKLVEH